jgi:anti-sigma regulatory factor (Ser/Thr protein kinase)
MKVRRELKQDRHSLPVSGAKANRLVREKIFQGTLDALEPIRKYVEATAHSAGLDSSASYRLCLAVDEIATNIIVHGYQEAGLKGDLKVRATVEKNNLVIELEDHGQIYDPDFDPAGKFNDLHRGLESRKIGGLGIFLARNGVDQIQYRVTDHGNVHRFLVRLPRGRGMKIPEA